MRPEMKRLRHLPIIWGPTPSRVATTALLGSRSHARTIFARNVSAAGSERDRVIATSCVRSSLEIVSIAFGRPVRIGYLLPSGYPKPCNNYATNLRDRTLASIGSSSACPIAGSELTLWRRAPSYGSKAPFRQLLKRFVTPALIAVQCANARL